MIIELEGIDGTGKTTQCWLLQKWLTEQGQKAIVVKDLESTELGRSIKKVLIGETARTVSVELFSFLACKGQLFSEIIKPASERGEIIICDRGIGSFLSYFLIHGYSKEFLDELLVMISEQNIVTYTILLDMKVKDAMLRKSTVLNPSKFDQMGEVFFEKQKKIFHKFAKDSSWTCIDGSMSMEDIHSKIISKVKGYL